MFEQTGDPVIANTLGYMYYYGRCNHSVPQYEEAFKYFSAGNAGGVYESRYKLSDMFRHGYGIPKNEKIANHLIWEVYWDTLPHILHGRDDTPFADAALRAGNIYRYGIDEETDPDEAVCYYLQAKYAIAQRMKATDQYGDRKVAKRINEALQDVLPLSRYAQKSSVTFYPSLQDLLMESFRNGLQMEMTMKKTADDSVHLTVRILPKTEKEPELFITVPGSHWCGRIPQLDIELIHIRQISFTEEECPIVFDEVRGNKFLLYGKTAAVIEAQYMLQIAS